MKIENVGEFIKNRKMLFFLFGTFLFMMNISISYSVVPVYLVSQNFTLAQIGISTTIYSLSAIFLRIFLGPLADRKGRKFALLISSFSFVISWMFIWFAPNFEVHLIARFVQAIGLAMYMSSASSVISDVVDNRILGSCMGIYRGFISMGVILGPVYALTLSGIGFNVMFIGIMATSFLSFILITFFSETKVAFGDLESTKKNNMVKDYLTLLKNPRLLRYYLAIMTVTSGFGIINTNSAVFLGSLEGVLKPSTFLFLFGCVGMVASLVSGRRTDRRGIKSVIIPGAFLALAGFFSMAFVESFGNLALFMVIVAMGFGTNSLVISSITGIGRETRNDLKATSYSIMESAYDGGFAVGNLIFGIMVTAFGYSQGFLIVGIILTLSYIGIFTGEFVRKRRRPS
ncbi:MAG: major facilitator superfamily protein [Fusobacteria bacterium]|nr:MAG: major facilitator superfamily protein [Fusobacteriota bacterium]KAF0228561.1 MAG: major facilitator superfamily [Fusobacteriota bacterium]